MEINKYHNSKIYKLISDHTDKIYIGSTVQPLHKRKSGHKIAYITFKNHNIKYISSYELIELGEIDIILIENFKCENKEELHARERYHIELNKELCVNINVPTRTKKEWNEDNKEYGKEYREKNKENIKEHLKEYREKNKEKIKEKQKEWNEKNQEKIKENDKEYYEKNKEKINEKQKEKSNCECGGKFTNSNKAVHLKSKKHLNFINTNQ